MNFSFISRCKRLLYLPFIICVHSLILLIILNLLVILNERQLIKTWTTQNSYLLSQLIIQRQENNLQNTRQLLPTLAELSAVRDHRVAECDQIFARILALNPLYANLGVADLKGNNWCSAVPMTQPISVLDRLHYQEAIRTKTFALGEYAIGRIVHEPVFHAAYPILDETDNVQGVVLAAISLRWLNTMLAATNLPEGSDVSIIDHRETILARFPNRETVGQKNTDPDISRALAEKPGHSTFNSSQSDGVKRLYTLSRFPDPTGKEIYTLVGIPASYFSQTANQAIKRNLLFTTIILALIFALTFLDWNLLIRKKILRPQKSPTEKSS